MKATTRKSLKTTMCAMATALAALGAPAAHASLVDGIVDTWTVKVDAKFLTSTVVWDDSGGTTTVSGPGQRCSTSCAADAGHAAQKRRAACASTTWTISGWSAGRPLAAKIAATAASSSARAPSP